MRLLRLDLRDDLDGLHLHPLITIVDDAEGRRRDLLLEVIRQLSTGSTTGLRGLIEHDGELVELESSIGSPFAHLATSASVVVHVDGPEVDRRSGGGIDHEIAWWEQQAALDDAIVEEIRAHFDLSIKARMWRQRAGPSSAVSVDRQVSPQQRKTAVGEALDSLASIARVVPNPDPELEALIARWDRYRERRRADEARLKDLAEQVAAAEAALVAALEADEQAKIDARPAILSSEDERRLEELFGRSHESSLFRKGLSQDEAAEMQALLASVGASSYTEYSVTRMSPTVPPDKLAMVQQAELEVERATEHLDRVRVERADDEAVRALKDELNAIKSECQPLLGVLVPSDIGAALRGRQTMIDNPDWLAAYNRLRDVLSVHEIGLPTGLDPDDAVSWTRDWLGSSTVQQGELGEASPQNTPAADDGNGRPEPSAVSSLPPVGPTQRSVAVSGPGLAAAVHSEPVDLAEDPPVDLSDLALLLARHEQALSQIDRAERNAARSALRLNRLRQLKRDTEYQAGPATAAEVMRLVAPAAERILEDVGGSVPLAVVGNLRSLPAAEIEALLDALDEVAQQIQVVLVSDNPVMAEWAARAGLGRVDRLVVPLLSTPGDWPAGD